MIQKENKSHQETFEQLKTEKTGLKRDELAEEISKIPSQQNIQKYKGLRYTFLSIMILIALAQLAALISVYLLGGQINSAVLILVLLIALVVPVLGITAVFKNQASLYRAAGGFMIYSAFRTFTDQGFSTDIFSIISLIIGASVIFLAFYIPYKLKTPYRKITKKGEDGKFRNQYFFDANEKTVQPDLLDG